MNPLPRLLGLGLIIVLAALAAVLAGPSWRAAPATPPPLHAAAATAPGRPVRLAEFAHRAAFPLALTGVVLATALFASLALRPARGDDAPARLSGARAEVDTLARLAESTAAQGAALAHERHGRERAEADVLLNQRLLSNSLEEKIHLGRDLHDGIIQTLYAAGLTIESARAVAKTDAVEADRRLEQTRQNLNLAIRDLRTYIAGLAPENLRQSGFNAALASLIAELGAARPVRFDLKIDDVAMAQLSPGQSNEALQVAREAISNALRHSAASHVTVRLHPGDGAVCLLVQDDGCGFDAAHRAGTGHGVVNMQARAESLGGTVRIESAAGNGTRVVLTLPIKA